MPPVPCAHVCPLFWGAYLLTCVLAYLLTCLLVLREVGIHQRVEAAEVDTGGLHEGREPGNSEALEGLRTGIEAVRPSRPKKGHG